MSIDGNIIVATPDIYSEPGVLGWRNFGMGCKGIIASIDLDDSGLIDGYELQQALRNAEIADLPPWDIAKLMEFVDIDGDGRVNLPELDIAIARVRSGVSEEE